jgi:hypothetical protein
MFSSLRYSALPVSRAKFSEYGAGVNRMLWPIRSRAARMSAREITSFKVAHTFSLFALRYRLRALRRTAISSNSLRGAFGNFLYKENLAAYERYFKPSASTGPSGLRDSPRPFVLRAAHLEGSTVTPGEEFELGINLFETNHPPLDLFRQIAAALTPAELLRADEPLVHLYLAPASTSIHKIRVHFLTPTELKGADHPDFATLFARCRDRISTLRALYGPGPLYIDFKSAGERAKQIRMTHSDLQHVAAERENRTTGHRHPLGGFTGTADYEGDLAEFVPYIQAAAYTGVGRQTVWGKGELRCEIL